jgi:N-acetylglucosaminyldiphosphoundecaprenol N-acetyl-beta-D-mannosaminyltransferase
MDEIKRRETRLLGLRIHSIKLGELIDFLESNADINKPLIIYGFSANIYSRLRKIPEFILFFNKMDIVVADGQGIPILAKLFNVDIKERVGIVNLSNGLLQLADKKKHKIFLLGSTEEINKIARENILRKFPQISGCTGRNGYFTSVNEESIVQEISKFSPDILFIGISSPIKEKFALKYKDKLGARLIIPCGGWIDVIAGNVKRPPVSLKKFPVTWFFRFIQEPRRMFGPIILTMIDSIFVIFPILYLKHLLGIEKNPSIITHLNLEKKLSKFQDL